METEREDENRSDAARPSNSPTPAGHSLSRAEPSPQAERPAAAAGNPPIELGPRELGPRKTESPAVENDSPTGRAESASLTATAAACRDAVPETRAAGDSGPHPLAGPTAHVVLYQPEIPQNTGNIGRSCVATGASLWIVRPAAFRLDDRSLRRAGLDYWQHLDLHTVANWAELRQQLPENEHRRYWYFSRFAKRSLWDAEMGPGDVLVFGSETSGLPASIRAAAGPQAVRLPTSEQVRSLNLATTVGVGLYEIVRRGGLTPPF